MRLASLAFGTLFILAPLMGCSTPLLKNSSTFSLTPEEVRDIGERKGVQPCPEGTTRVIAAAGRADGGINGIASCK